MATSQISSKNALCKYVCKLLKNKPEKGQQNFPRQGISISLQVSNQKVLALPDVSPGNSNHRERRGERG